MTIDERLGALTQTVELLATLHRETEIHIAKLATSQAQTEKMVRGIGRYAMAIAHDHEKRIFDLEHFETE